MYVTRLKAVLVTALRQTFDDPAYPNSDFNGLWVDIEYPLKKQQYPSVWVNYDDRDSLQIVSIDHREFVTDIDGRMHQVTRWTFAGTVTFTAVALSSLERDNLFDELVRIYSFGRVEEGAVSKFRGMLDNNDFLVLRVNWDEARPGGDAASPGTPWGTDNEVIYEKSLSFDLEGDFISDATNSGELLQISRIVVAADQVDNDGDAVLDTQYLDLTASGPTRHDPTQWH